MVEKRVNKELYLIELKLLKLLPYIAALFYLTTTILSYFRIDVVVFNTISGQSLLSLLFMWVSSYVFKFCIYHRIPIYYMLINDIISYYDWYIGIPIDNKELLVLHVILAGITMFVILYLYLKSRSNEKCCNNNTR